MKIAEPTAARDCQPPEPYRWPPGSTPATKYFIIDIAIHTKEFNNY